MKNTFSSAARVIELTRTQGPQKGTKTEHAHAKSNGNQKQKCCHDSFPLFTRSAFTVTTIEEPDMAIAAMSGVTRPASAIGTAIML